MNYQEPFKKGQMAEITGLSARQIQFYTENVGVQPDLKMPKKKGSDREYSRENAIEFLIIKELKEQSISLAAIKRIIKIIREEGKARSQRWWTERIHRKKSVELAYLLIYEPFNSNKMDIKFHVIAQGVGHLFKSDGSPWNLQEYTRRDKGNRMVLILDLSMIIESVMQKSNI
jgi:DNA-binding transcriptional MerR regulator